MLNIFDKYGIKEVANVYFEALDDEPKAKIYKGDIVLFLDTLKVSTIETSAENTTANGGWGNPNLISWDYGKEITISLTDALISMESLRFMMGGAIHTPSANEKVIVRHTEEVVCGAEGVVPKPKDHLTGKEYTVTASATRPVRLINLTTGLRTQLVTGTIDGTKAINFKNEAMTGSETEISTRQGEHIRIFWEEEVTGANNADTAVEISISPDTFPGSYRIIGDTFIRSQKTGKDEAFQFIIGKAKVLSNVTLTLEAEGDPSTFELQLQVLRDDNERGEKEMMKLIRYGSSGEDEGTVGDDEGSIGL